MNLKTRFQKQLASARQSLPVSTEAEGSKSVPWWALLPSLLLVTAVGIWLWLRQESSEAALPGPFAEKYPTQPAIELKAEQTVHTPAIEPVEETKPETVKNDDLRRIEGIGPKIASVFQNAGIRTFSDLAAAEPEWLLQILKNSGIRLANPETWPEQASLAAKEDWEGLKSLQAHLKGGRRA